MYLSRKQITAALDDAYAVFAERGIEEFEVDVHVFSETWSSTTLIFGGIGGQAISNAFTVVAIAEGRTARIYVGGRFYREADPSSPLWAKIFKRSFTR